MNFQPISSENTALAGVLGLLLWCGVMVQETYASVDAYVIYSGNSQQEKQLFLDKLPKKISVKSYNVDRMAVADYSWKQKMLANFNKASVIVFLLDEPMKIFKGSRIMQDLVIVQSVMAGVKSEGRTLYVLTKGTDFSHLKNISQSFEMAMPEGLQQKDALNSDEVILVDEQTLGVVDAASIVTERVLGL